MPVDPLSALPAPTILPQGAKELPIEFQKHITTFEFINRYFYQRLCGHRKITTKDTKVDAFGAEDNYSEKWIVNEKTRLCNESCADVAFTSMIGLISQLTTTAKLTEQKIYDSWNGGYYSLKWDLINNLANGNSYELKGASAIPVITSFYLSFNSVSYKALDGFTLIEIAESIMTQTLIKNGFEPKSASGGGLGALVGNIFGGKKTLG